MNLVLVHYHPEAGSLTEAVTSRVVEGFTVGTGDTVDVMDLHREGFDAHMTAQDLAFYRGLGELPEDVKVIQRRIDRADALALVFPMYWWSTPGVVKGWFDRVLTRAWAFDYSAEGTVVPLLQHLPVLLVVVAATDRSGLQKHGYEQALQTQLNAGILGFCGMTDVRTHILFESEAPDGEKRREFLAGAADLGRELQRSSQLARRARIDS